MKHPIVIANLLGVDGKQTTISSDLCLQISLRNASNKKHNLTNLTYRTKRFQMKFYADMNLCESTIHSLYKEKENIRNEF